jgi:rhodanese-related sulfurtransferase
VAAVNIAGGEDTFPGIVGTAICKVFDYACARTGITERAAREAGRDVVTARSPGPDKAHYYPGGKPIFMKVLVERGSRQVLGAQAVGPGACDRQINVVAMALQAGMTVDQLAQADLCYAPPYSQAIDNVITTANVARNTLDDALTYLAPSEVQAMRANGSAFTLLDVRTPREVEEVRIPGSLNIPLGQLRARVDEVPAGKPVVAFCKASLRGYEAALILRHAGRDDVSVLQGGLAMWPYEKEQ